TGLASLFGDVASGKHITTVELAGARTNADQSVKVYDVKLSNVLVSSFENDPGPNGVETSLSLNYSKISLTTQPPTKDVVLGIPETFSFDVNKLETAAAVSSDIASSVALSDTSAAAAAVAVLNESPLHYFIKIGDLKGDSTVEGFEGWFSVDGYDIGV